MRRPYDFVIVYFYGYFFLLVSKRERILLQITFVFMDTPCEFMKRL